jgi:hypothetical protein
MHATAATIVYSDAFLIVGLSPEDLKVVVRFFGQYHEWHIQPRDKGVN